MLFHSIAFTSQSFLNHERVDYGHVQVVAKWLCVVLQWILSVKTVGLCHLIHQISSFHTSIVGADHFGAWYRYVYVYLLSFSTLPSLHLCHFCAVISWRQN